MDTTGFGGRRLEKTAEVVTNDPREPVVQLSIAGTVDRFAAINPRLLNLRGQAGQKLQGTVSIVPEKKYPFKVLGVKSRDGRLKADFAATEEGGAPAYALRIENLRTETGSYNDTVVVRTDSPLRPELEVRVFVYLRPAAPAEKKVN